MNLLIGISDLKNIEVQLTACGRKLSIDDEGELTRDCKM